jgi:hypothetical protein
LLIEPLAKSAQALDTIYYDPSRGLQKEPSAIFFSYGRPGGAYTISDTLVAQIAVIGSGISRLAEVYNQALQLWLKRVPLFAHPNRAATLLPKRPVAGAAREDHLAP